MFEPAFRRLYWTHCPVASRRLDQLDDSKGIWIPFFGLDQRPRNTRHQDSNRGFHFINGVLPITLCLYFITSPGFEPGAPFGCVIHYTIKDSFYVGPKTHSYNMYISSKKYYKKIFLIYSIAEIIHI